MAVLLISVDKAYGMSESDAASSATKAMRAHGVDWPCTIEPNGWEGVNRRFGIDGYHVFLVGKDGKVVNADVYPEQLRDSVNRALGD